MTLTKTFYTSRALARASGKPVKDAGFGYAATGKRWYTEEAVSEEEKQQLQQIFDAAAKHLLKQNKKSVSSNGMCVYRSTDGLMCAAGVFIAPAYYKPSLEGKTVSRPAVQDALKKSGYPVGNHEAFLLLSRLQDCHDEFPPSLWKGKLYSIASRYNLDAKILENF